MEKKTIRKLLMIVYIALTVACLIFLGIGFFADGESRREFYVYALFCTSLANLFNIIRINNKD